MFICRVYNESSLDELATLKSCTLLYIFEQPICTYLRCIQLWNSMQELRFTISILLPLKTFLQKKNNCHNHSTTVTISCLLECCEDVVFMFKFFFDKILMWQNNVSLIYAKNEFVSVLYLLDNAVPIVLFHYQMFLSGDLNDFENLRFNIDFMTPPKTYLLQKLVSRFQFWTFMWISLTKLERILEKDGS